VENNDLIEKLSGVEHYKKYPSMIPYIGKDYISDKHKKLLIIGESHYLPEKSFIHYGIETWYNGNESNLIQIELDWIHTAGCVLANNSIFRTVEKALTESGITISNPKDQYAFYNFFQRPAPERKSFKTICSQIDKDFAIENFKSVISILKPDIIIFVSKLSFDVVEWMKIWEFSDMSNSVYTYTNHPTCPWWNRSTRPLFFEGRTSREHFKYFLQKNNFIGIN